MIHSCDRRAARPTPADGFLNETERFHQEEWLDRHLFRPLSLPVARLGARLGLRPNTVSFVGALFGVAGGWFFQYREAAPVACGVGLFLVRHVLDYADGQLARLTGRGTKYGVWFDGLCDYSAYLSVYVFGAVGLWPELGWKAAALALAAAWCSGLQSQLFDFYKVQYSYWALGSDRDRFRSPEELRAEPPGARRMDRLLLRLATGYAAQQRRFARARLAHHDAWLPHRGDPDFRDRYARRNRGLLEAWSLVGPNWHAYLFSLFGLLGRMDLFFAVQLLGQNALLMLLLVAQRVSDRRVLLRPSA